MLPEAGVSKSMNFKDTELTLGQPGGGRGGGGGGGGYCSSSSADHDHVFSSFGGFKSMKRGFMEMVDHLDLDSSTSCEPRGQVKMNGKLEANKPYSSSSSSSSSTTSTTVIKAPAAKARVLGWPPVRLLRQKAMAESRKYVKVGADGAPYLRKLDLVMYQSYQDLLAALKQMFTSFTICGKYMEDSNEAMMKPAVKGIVEYYVLTYEDKDGDWMLVGDVPWKMFMESCKRIRLMKSSETVGIYSSKSNDSPATTHE